ncbi:hypothetical protein NPIL_81141 [Nephila pilipes]|uniref:Uncharacterized protein n=1 Tax=Nephila pilipes TaxID=299642 RepID=A0A8X6U9R8_NEPPI|nr:hypothetical protein NPIL_81141 [Nephila pilipes]
MIPTVWEFNPMVQPSSDLGYHCSMNALILSRMWSSESAIFEDAPGSEATNPAQKYKCGHLYAKNASSSVIDTTILKLLESEGILKDVGQVMTNQNGQP